MMTFLCRLSATWNLATQARAFDGVRVRLQRIAGGHTVLGVQPLEVVGPRMVKKLMRLSARSISGALQVVPDTEWGLHARGFGSSQETARHCPCPDDSARDENAGAHRLTL